MMPLCAVEDMAELTHLIDSLQNESRLSFTIELSNNNKIPFLDVLVDISNEELETSAYRKSTATGTCLYGRSECTDSYKKGVIIRAYVIRALKLSSTWNHCHRELQHIRQLLVNNGYTNTMFDEIANKTIEQHVSHTQLSTDQSQSFLSSPSVKFRSWDSVPICFLNLVEIINPTRGDPSTFGIKRDLFPIRPRSLKSK